MQFLLQPGKISYKFSFPKVISYLEWALKRRDIAFTIATVELKKSVIGTKLSYLWWLLDPLLNFFCYLFLVFVFNKHSSLSIPYPLYILTAILPWHFTKKSIQGSVQVWDRYKSIIGQIRFPYINLLLATVIYETVLFCMSMIIVIVACISYGFYPKLIWLNLILIITLHTLLNAGLMIVNSIISFAFFDYHKIMPFILRFWFYTSPAIWSITMIPERYRYILKLNPMTYIFEMYRYTLLYNKSIQLPSYQNLFLIIFLIFVFSLPRFVKVENYINRYV